MSASEIIKELPNLSEAERRTIREELLEIANQDPDVALCNQAALDGVLTLDQMESEDARRQSLIANHSDLLSPLACRNS